MKNKMNEYRHRMIELAWNILLFPFKALGWVLSGTDDGVQAIFKWIIWMGAINYMIVQVGR